MKISLKIIIVLSILFSTASNANLFAQKVNGDDYKLIWEDNFNKPVLDESKWTATVSDKGGGNRELQYYRHQNVAIDKEPISGKSCLVITAKKEEYKSKTCTSGHISTDDKMSFKYGKLEARIKIPQTADGLWPAFWMLGTDHNDVSWPKCGEIDIVEMGKLTGITNNVQDKYFNGACHWGESWNGGSYPNKGISTTNNYSLQDDFHTYTLLWTADSINMYLDLNKYPNIKPYYSMPISGDGLVDETSRYFRKPYYIIFNLAIGGTFPEIYDINDITALDKGDAKMYVDYIRLYQAENENAEFITKSKNCFINWFRKK